MVLAAGILVSMISVLLLTYAMTWALGRPGWAPYVASALLGVASFATWVACLAEAGSVSGVVP